MDSNNFFTPVKNLYTQMKGNISFPQSNNHNHNNSNKNSSGNNKKSNSSISNSNDGDLTPYDNIYINNYEDNKQQSNKNNSSIINSNKSKGSKSSGNNNNSSGINNDNEQQNYNKSTKIKQQQQQQSQLPHQENIYNQQMDDLDDYVPKQPKVKSKSNNNNNNHNNINNNNSYNFNNNIGNNLFDEGINYNTYDDNSYKNGSTYYTNNKNNNNNSPSTSQNKHKPLASLHTMNSQNNNNNLNYSNSFNSIDNSDNNSEYDNNRNINNNDVFDELSLGDSNNSIKGYSSFSGGKEKSNKKNSSLDLLASEFEDFVEIKDKNVSPICFQYYIPFYQSSEMCSNEARKWLEERWFLPANFKDIQWSSPSRFYFPVYVFSVTSTTFYSATYTINDYPDTIHQQKLTSIYEEVVFCASTSFDSTLVDQLVKEGSYSNRSTHLLPPIDELSKYSPNQTKLLEKVLSVDISKDEITEKYLKPYLEKEEKKKCIKEVQDKFNVKNVELTINKLLIDKEDFSIVFIPINSLTYQYGDKLYETLTSGKKSKTVGFRPIGTGYVGGAIYGMVSKVSTTVKESI